MSAFLGRLLAELGLGELASLPEGALGATLAIVLARVAPLALIAPWMGGARAPWPLRLGLVGALALALLPAAIGVTPPSTAPGLVLALVREALVGGAFAVAISVPLFALEEAGAVIDRVRGGTGEALRTWYAMLGAALFFALGGHRVALVALAADLGRTPLGGALDGPALALGTARIVTSALVLTAAFAAPAVALVLVTELALALWARASAGLEARLVAVPLRAVVALAAILLGLAMLSAALRDALATAASNVLSG